MNMKLQKNNTANFINPVNKKFIILYPKRRPEKLIEKLKNHVDKQRKL